MRKIFLSVFLLLSLTACLPTTPEMNQAQVEAVRTETLETQKDREQDRKQDDIQFYQDMEFQRAITTVLTVSAAILGIGGGFGAILVIVGYGLMKVNQSRLVYADDNGLYPVVVSGVAGNKTVIAPGLMTSAALSLHSGTLADQVKQLAGKQEQKPVQLTDHRNGNDAERVLALRGAQATSMIRASVSGEAVKGERTRARNRVEDITGELAIIDPNVSYEREYGVVGEEGNVERITGPSNSTNS